MADGVSMMELYAMTPREVQLRLYGILKKQIDAKRNIRSLIYAIHVHNTEQKNRLEVWDLMQIAGDPTPKERQKAHEKQQKAEARKLVRMAKKMGYLS